jgi:hypothetical protein
LIFFFVLAFGNRGIAQIRLTTLTLEPREVYELQGTDVMVVDTLTLGDSARIILNKAKKDNFIHVKKLVVGRGVVIEAKGKIGLVGLVGSAGPVLIGPCKDGIGGQPGTPGTGGKDAVNLFLYFNELKISGNLLIDLAGGDGGDGGKGGPGGDGNPGTKLCQGGNGGTGGNGGAGGNGGNAGNLTITSRYGADLRNLMGEKIIVRSFGGFAGLGGEGGLGGMCGLSSLRDGVPGRRGQSGPQGTAGKPGGVFFERK